jgi:hypothetical protein
MTNPGSDFIFKAHRELCGTLWDLVGHPKIDFRHYAHVSEVEYRGNHESGLIIFFLGTKGTPQDTLGFPGTPKNRFLALCTCFKFSNYNFLGHSTKESCMSLLNCIDIFSKSSIKNKNIK